MSFDFYSVKVYAMEDVNKQDSPMVDQEASEFFKQFNTDLTQLYDVETQLKQILGKTGKDIKVVPPLVCTHGSNTFLGNGVHINLETFFDDKREIHLGNRVLTGPFLRILTTENNGHEGDVNIEDDVWIGGGVTIHPGVRIGSGAVISAGSVVTQDVPPNALMVGAPARLIREIDQTQEPEGVNSDTGESEQQKMTTQKVFYSSDPQLKEDKQKAYEFFRDFNLHGSEISPEVKRERLATILGAVGENIDINNFYFSYGYQIFIGNGVTIGDRVFLGDAGKITIGDNVVLEPEVQLYTTNHCLPIPYRGYIVASDITISQGAKIGKRAIILPGVSVGEGAVVMENSVVNRDVPPHTVVSGIPARTVKQ